MKPISIAVTLTLALVAGTAIASTGNSGDKEGMTFNQLDRNDNGRISKKEAKRSLKLAEQFDKLDRNDNGKLSRREFSKARSGSGMSSS